MTRLICVECGASIQHVFREFSKGNIRLTKCVHHCGCGFPCPHGLTRPCLLRASVSALQIRMWSLNSFSSFWTCFCTDRRFFAHAHMRARSRPVGDGPKCVWVKVYRHLFFNRAQTLPARFWVPIMPCCASEKSTCRSFRVFHVFRRCHACVRAAQLFFFPPTYSWMWLSSSTACTCNSPLWTAIY